MNPAAPTKCTSRGRPDDRSSSLVVQVQGKQHRAWRRLVHLYGPIVYRWARQAGVEPEPSGRIVEDVFRSVATHIGQFRRDQPRLGFRTWLWTIARGRLGEHFRSQSGSGRLPAGVDAPTEASDVPELARLEAEQSRSGPADAALVHRALEAIRADFEAAVWESFWQRSVAGRPAADVARELDCTLGDVRDGNYRVLRRLRQELDEMR